jgi:hypothetical protein
MRENRETDRVVHEAMLISAKRGWREREGEF